MAGPGQTDDLAKLPRLDAQVILHELKHRYSQDKIYTYVGDILIAVNPFKSLNIYDKNASSKYKQAAKSSAPPHIYAVANSAYQAMLGRGGAKPHNQCCVISGESGAGKTESAKFIINQVIELSHGDSQLEQQILQVNPLLEAFGNAQTLMNDNSSRFGKYIQLKFLNGGVIGAKISEYLLEKSRVALQNTGEQNFHIFYYIFAGLSQEDQKIYGLGSPKNYSYLSNGYDNKNMKKNKEMFNKLMNAIDLVGFLEEEQINMFLLLSLVLNMGNLDIDVDEEDNAVVNDQDALNVVAKLLGTDANKLRSIITSTSTTTKGSIIKRRLKRHQALDVRDATAKALYGRLFSWIVNKINRLLAPPATARGQNVMEIGILDIFGFEHFENNSFEQACINLANEQLQFFFNQHIFMWEQEEYKREGIDWTTITFEDNKPVLDLFLEKPIGLLALLDEESHFPQSTDQTFVQKLVKNCGKSKHLVTSRQSQLSKFTIVHYAGKVEYDSFGFLEKNRDTLPQGVTEALEKSSNELISTIFTATVSRTGTLALGKLGADARMRKSRVSKPARQLKPNTKKGTVSSQFRTSLTVLMEKLTAASPHFIRCIKPNHMKVSGNFDSQYVEDQLKYTGVLETTRIRREGYPVRPTFEEFVDSYKLIVYDPFLKASESSSRRILKKSKLNDWHIGKTKVFLKYWHAEELVKKLGEVHRSVIKMQKVVRGFLIRRRKKRLIKAAEEHNLKPKDCLQLIQLKNADINKGIEALKEKKRIEMIVQRSKTKYASLDFEKTKQTSTGTGTGTQTFSTLDDVRFVDQGVGDFDLGEDEFVREPDANKAKFGAVATKETAVQWYQETQAPKGAGMETHGVFHEWFHGVISRRRSEMLLIQKPIGCFLVRVSESRFGYSLSYRVINRCKHYMIDQTRSGKYVIVGLPKVFKSLNELVEYHQETPINDEGDVLIEPCGQENDNEADYVDLLTMITSPRNLRPPADIPPALPERRYKSTMKH